MSFALCLPKEVKFSDERWGNIYRILYNAGLSTLDCCKLRAALEEDCWLASKGLFLSSQPKSMRTAHAGKVAEMEKNVKFTLRKIRSLPDNLIREITQRLIGRFYGDDVEVKKFYYSDLASILSGKSRKNPIINYLECLSSVLAEVNSGLKAHAPYCGNSPLKRALAEAIGRRLLHAGLKLTVSENSPYVRILYEVFWHLAIGIEKSSIVKIAKEARRALTKVG